MVKRLSQLSQKVSKQDEKKKNLKTLINLLRPKVYITDSSSFKSLVQELTGNGTKSCPSSPPPPPPPPPPLPPTKLTILEKVPNIEDIIEDDHLESETSIKSSFDSSNMSNPIRSFVGVVGLSPDDSSDLSNTSTTFVAMENQNSEDLEKYSELESWLLEMEEPEKKGKGKGDLNMALKHGKRMSYMLKGTRVGFRTMAPYKFYGRHTFPTPNVLDTGTKHPNQGIDIPVPSAFGAASPINNTTGQKGKESDQYDYEMLSQQGLASRSTAPFQ
ncbi:VQ protein [Dillenia turbinata]|uniref:VQ protein n=1 Tax=Dillenia turbinata TaxID=194707 RepID=A0AAN8Z0B8_9MAGN